MPIQIQKSNSLTIQQITAIIYGAPGTGKSSLAATAGNVLVLDTDRGMHRAAGPTVDVVQIYDWRRDLSAITPSDLQPYDTIVLDTLGAATDLLSAEIAGQRNMTRGGGQLSLQGFGALKSQMAAFLNLLRQSGKDVVLVAHATESDNDGQMVQRVRAAGSTREDVLQFADVIARVYIDRGRRMLSAEPGHAAHGKDLGIGTVELPALTEQPDFLCTLLRQAKASVNDHAVPGTATPPPPPPPLTVAEKFPAASVRKNFQHGGLLWVPIGLTDYTAAVNPEDYGGVNRLLLKQSDGGALIECRNGDDDLVLSHWADKSRTVIDEVIEMLGDASG